MSWYVQRRAAEGERTGYHLFGDATIVHPGNGPNSDNAIAATSTGTNGFGGIAFKIGHGHTLAQLNELATDDMFTTGSCGLGSPRFSVDLTNGTVSGNILFYIGPPPNYTVCPPNVWTNIGNLATPASLVDDTHLPGGTFYDTYANAQAKYGTYTITGIALIADGPNQTVQFDNTNVNGSIHRYETDQEGDD